jgi:peptide/nickel transport system permease protein
MTAYLARRLLLAIPVLIAVTFAGFLILGFTPGDPIRARLDPEVLSRMSTEQIDAMRAQFGLDAPIHVQYVRWVAGVLQGDLGFSVATRQPVLEEIGGRLPPTLLLMGTALLIGLLIGIPFGVLSALRQYSWLDYALTTSTMVLISVPIFVVGLVAIYLFGIALDLLPVGGMATLGSDFDPVDRAAHLALPALVLGIGISAPFMRYTRAAMLDVLGADHIRTATSKGLSYRIVMTRHAFRNALIPIITLLGLLVPELIAGALITEQLFAWPGMGSLAVQAAGDRDPALMTGIILVVGIAVLASSIAADVGYAVADPRIRYS